MPNATDPCAFDSSHTCNDFGGGGGMAGMGEMGEMGGSGGSGRQTPPIYIDWGCGSTIGDATTNASTYLVIAGALGELRRRRRVMR